MIRRFGAAFGTPSQPILAEYADELSRLVSTLATARKLLWRSVLAGTEDAMRDLPTPSLRHAWGITPDDGDGDEHPLARKRMAVQGIITACVDSGIQEGLLQ